MCFSKKCKFIQNGYLLGYWSRPFLYILIIIHFWGVKIRHFGANSEYGERNWKAFSAFHEMQLFNMADKPLKLLFYAIPRFFFDKVVNIKVIIFWVDRNSMTLTCELHSRVKKAAVTLPSLKGEHNYT